MMHKTLSIFKIHVMEDIFSCQSFTEQEKKKLNSEFSDYEDIQYEKLNFDDMTIEDLIDHIDFSEHEFILFILDSYSKRFLNILEYISNILEKNLEVLFLEDNKTHPLDKNYREIKNCLNFANDINLTMRLNTSYHSIKSGFYNHQETIHIKHIIIDDLSKIVSLDNSIFLNLSINSLIIYKYSRENTEYIRQNTFSKLLSESQFNTKIQKFHYRKIELDTELERLRFFYEVGKITYLYGLPADLKRIFNNKNINSIFVKDDYIYLDSNYMYPISKNLLPTVYELISKYRELIYIEEEYINLDFCIYYFVANKIVNKYKEDLFFFTPLNYGKYPPVSQRENIIPEYKYCIAFKNINSNYYIHNFYKGKTIKVTRTLFDKFELLIKDRISNEESLREVKELLKNVI